MMSKYNRPALTSWFKKRPLRAAFLTLVMASMTASPVCVRPSLAQEPRSNDQSQQKPAGESQRPTPVRDGSNWDRRIPQKPAGEMQNSAPVRDGSTWEQQTPASELQNSDAPQDTEEVSLQAVWHPWEAIGNPPGAHQSFRPSATGRATGELDVVDVTSNGDVWHKWWSASTGWSGWGSLGQPPPGTYTLPGAGIAGRRNGNLDIFSIAEDGDVWHKWWSASTGWSGWGSLGAPAGANHQLIGIAATGRATGELDVIVTDIHNILSSQTVTIWHKWWSASTGWSGWDSLGDLAWTSHPPSLAGRENGELDVFVSSAGVVWYKWLSISGGWRPWGALDGVVTGLAAAGRADGKLDVVGRGADGTIYHKWWSSLSGWSQWGSLGALPTGEAMPWPGIAALRGGQLYVFAKDSAGKIYYTCFG